MSTTVHINKDSGSVIIETDNCWETFKVAHTHRGQTVFTKPDRVIIHEPAEYLTHTSEEN